MRIGMVGLGKMGRNMAARLVEKGHEVVGYDVDERARARAVAEGVERLDTLAEVVSLPQPRVLWVMVPAGDPTESTLADLAELLESGDILVDGGNTHYRDTIRRAQGLAARGVALVDAGTSGGVWGRRCGYSLMVGGDEAAVERLRPVLEALAPQSDRGWGRVGPSGSGHFVKMVHNGIEYGLMQAYAEGFDLMAQATEMNLDLGQVASVWRHGSVVRSWLLELVEEALQREPTLASFDTRVPDSGEGRWTVQEAVARGVPVPAVAAAVFHRLKTQDNRGVAARVLNALRYAFGGHEASRSRS